MILDNTTNNILETDMLLNGIDIPLELLDSKACFVSANNAFLKLLNIPGIQKGKQCHMFMPCPLHCRCALDETCILTEVVRTHRPVKHSTMIGNRCFIIRANPVFGADGEIAFFVKSYTDISEQTERIRQESVLNRCLESFFLEPDTVTGMRKVSRALCSYMDASRLFIMRINSDLLSAHHYFEYSADGSSFFSVVQDWHFDPAEKWYQLFVEQKFVLQDDVNAPDASDMLGRWTDFFQKSTTRSIYVAPIFLEGKLWGDFGITYDRQTQTQPELRQSVLKHVARLFGEILSREKMRNQVLDSLRDAQQANKAKSFFLASVSHELRTPLNAVIGFTELLKTGKITQAETIEYLNLIESSANALSDLINDVLDLSKLESGEMDIIKEAVDFRLLAESVTKYFSKAAQEKKVHLSCDVPNLPRMVLDLSRVRQILFNLIGNAVKFTKKGSVDVSASFSDGRLSFSVRDTGPGIPTDDLRKLTEPFVRLTRMRGTNASNHGTGLGLAVVKKLLSAMDGELKIESELGKGSLFIATLNRVENAQDHSALPLEVSALPQTGKPPLLLVDDVSMNLKVLAAICREAGYTDITTASSGEEAFRLLLKKTFGLVLTDLWMPEMNGEELVKKIRSDHRLSALPVFAVTADMEAKDHFDMALFNGVIHKPVMPDKIKLLPF